MLRYGLLTVFIIDMYLPFDYLCPGPEWIIIVQPKHPVYGTFTLTNQGKTTRPLPANATAAEVQAAIEKLPNRDEPWAW